jgi:hypothetical protein
MDQDDPKRLPPVRRAAIFCEWNMGLYMHGAKILQQISTQGQGVMNVEKIARITISYQSLDDLIAARTGNPIAEAEIPGMLKDAIRRGTPVILTDIYGKDSASLQLKDGKFVYIPVA